jgi:hypothetical protein
MTHRGCGLRLTDHLLGDEKRLGWAGATSVGWHLTSVGTAMSAPWRSSSPGIPIGARGSVQGRLAPRGEADATGRRA